tara:strand:- start:5092 stop:5748 length:657 start_codon:yes stop_codon:yes gene_type:complete
MSFKEKKYTVVKSAISKELATFIYDYFSLKRRVARTMFDKTFISPFTEDWGYWGDKQVPDTYSHYGDVVMETLLEKLLPLMKEQTGLDLVPTYSYARIYKQGDVLERHKDRPSCEISTTLSLGGDHWPIYLEPNKNVGIPGKDGCTAESNNPGLKIFLHPGDMLIYSGCVLEHWREEFKGENCAQVFLHYNNVETQGVKNIYDDRVHLGLPSRTRKCK